MADVSWCSRASLDAEVHVPERSGPDSLFAGVEFRLDGQQDYELVLQGVQGLDVLQPGGDMVVPQRQGGGAGPEVLLGGRQMVVTEGLE